MFLLDTHGFDCICLTELAGSCSLQGYRKLEFISRLFLSLSSLYGIIMSHQIVSMNLVGSVLCTHEAMRVTENQHRGGHIFNMDGAGSGGSSTLLTSVLELDMLLESVKSTAKRAEELLNGINRTISLETPILIEDLFPDYGMFHFCITDSEHDWREDSEQYAWIEKCLPLIDRKQQPWLIISAHRMLGYSSNSWYAMEGSFEDPMGREHYRSYDRNTKLILHSMDMFLIMK